MYSYYTLLYNIIPYYIIFINSSLMLFFLSFYYSFRQFFTFG